MSRSLELDVFEIDARALSLAPAMQVAVGDVAADAALTTDGQQADAGLAAAAPAAESVAVIDVDASASDTLTCAGAAEMRIYWGELQEWFKQA